MKTGKILLRIFTEDFYVLVAFVPQILLLSFWTVMLPSREFKIIEQLLPFL